MQPIHRTLACCAVLAAQALPSLAQTTWYVDVSAPPPGNGTAGSPYTQINYAIHQASTLSGDTLLVAPGTYEAFTTDLKGLKVVSTAGPEQTLIDGTSYLIGPDTGPLFRLTGFTILVGTEAMLMDVAELERCIVQPKNPPGILAIRCGLAYGGSNAIFTHCSLSGFYTGVEETPFASAYIYLTNSVFDCLNEDVRGESGNLTLRYSYAAKLHYPNPTVVHPVPGPVPGLWDSAQGDVHLLPLSNCIDAGDPALPHDPDGSIADVGALLYDAQHAPHPTTYCAGFVHSGGCAPRIVWSGTPSLSGPDDFVISSSLSLNNVLGLFLVGTNAGSIPFSAGRICVAPPFVRGPVVASGGSSGAPNCSGVFVWPVSQAYMQQHWQPGQVLYTQCWGRDPGSSYPEKSQLSNALVFKVEP
jgi:hypothetical protein